MNIQIFGKAKCFDSKKAEWYFKERKVKYQFIDISKYGLSIREYNSVKNAVGDMYRLINEKSKEYEKLHIKYLVSETDIEEKLLDNPNLFKTPVVRNGKLATVGYQPDIWKDWE